MHGATNMKINLLSYREGGVNKQGATLIEFLIYLTLLTIIAYSSSSWIISIWQNFLHVNNKTKILLNLYSSHDTIVRDCISAQQIVELTPDCLVMQKKDLFCGYYHEKSALIRYEGNYKPSDKKWYKAHKSVLVKPIDTVVFKQRKNAIQFDLALDTYHVYGIIQIGEKIV